MYTYAASGTGTGSGPMHYAPPPTYLPANHQLLPPGMGAPGVGITSPQGTSIGLSQNTNRRRTSYSLSGCTVLADLTKNTLIHVLTLGRFISFPMVFPILIRSGRAMKKIEENEEASRELGSGMGAILEKGDTRTNWSDDLFLLEYAECDRIRLDTASNITVSLKEKVDSLQNLVHGNGNPV
ncbi:hypothetical protein RUM44_011166 [Polyplax serrata]|uniref:Uncharacterized protein n=1 Tax=Polyplax serrata TaxID=468196 RepID=A0ABR1AP87_POLSC